MRNAAPVTKTKIITRRGWARTKEKAIAVVFSFFYGLVLEDQKYIFDSFIMLYNLIVVK